MQSFTFNRPKANDINYEKAAFVFLVVPRALSGIRFDHKSYKMCITLGATTGTGIIFGVDALYPSVRT